MGARADRLFRTQPKKVEEQVGVEFVSILFGIVVGLLVAQAAGEVQAWLSPSDEIRWTRLLHLVVAITLTVTSFLGYYASRNRPTHRIYFFNLPLMLFVLDVMMVFAYYVLFQFTESAIGAAVATRADARPEAAIIAIAFGLYVLWDLASWRIQADALYQSAIGRTATDEFGGRRVVSIVFLVVFLLGAVVVCIADPESGLVVALVDWWLILGLIAYRIAKPMFDENVTTRPR